ncbi:hypothetical protein LOC67_24450 [Stieleria sp. JC731]|uniref:hypothetical protein n=1 Tax=Pirellulaceae TaxID=2691357 RepID=UPI001E3237EA|nr:hypothetical protein [Stieleria sp. JC731]MCC9603713.1 hypothetical protein [Stieleria sp. JC731]
MTNEPNPYASPTLDEVDPGSIWKRLWKFFTGPPRDRIPNFAAGEAIIYEGISFFIDPDNPSELFAASPSVDHSQRRMNLIVAETLRLLPALLAEYPDFQGVMLGRKLRVRMIDSYQDSRCQYHTEYAIEWDYVSGFIVDPMNGTALD